jgi:hypothetical protein
MDVREIFKSDDLLKFWPSSNQTAKERVFATTRFILYSTCIVYLIQRDSRVFALGMLVLAVLFYLQKNNMIVDGKNLVATGRVPNLLQPNVTLPTQDNPMGNVLLNEYVDDPDRPSAAWYPSVRTEVQQEWSKIHPFERTRDAERNFYTMPVTTIPGDQTGFAEASFGKKFSPMCKDQGGAACDPDNFNFHFPEVTQMRGGRGGNGAGGSN